MEMIKTERIGEPGRVERSVGRRHGSRATALGGDHRNRQPHNLGDKVVGTPILLSLTTSFWLQKALVKAAQSTA